MAEYISREAYINHLEELSKLLELDLNNTFEDGVRIGIERAIMEADNFSAADVRPVVLCKDCKYYYKDADGYEMCDNSEGYDHVTEDGFCAWAKKREES